MKNLKKIIICLLAFALGGCSTINNWITNESNLTNICATAEGLAKTGTVALVTKKPAAQGPMLIVANSIEVLLQTNEGVKPDIIDTEIKKALDETKCDETVKSSILLVTDSVITFYSAVYKANVEANFDDACKGYVKILNSICTGIREGCSSLAQASAVKAYIPAECYKRADYIFTH
jgi:hypothetical protein